jgi:hypothetical protein
MSLNNYIGCWQTVVYFGASTQDYYCRLASLLMLPTGSVDATEPNARERIKAGAGYVKRQGVYNVFYLREDV